ncbi:hypothetical protein BKA62DRAFT_771333 [Auriculariales sp. MPI-PUGE-AT-0066]|nr:hypothetical protein BKA62DRAFT_771333 [Auriculariales sp. MPI-PUGE-AT-0066]
MSDANNAPAVPAVEEIPGHKVFAGNLAYSTTDEGLKTFFAPVAADVLSAQVILRGTRSAGYGFVAFKDAASAEKAVSLLNKKELDGREVIVEKASRRGAKAPTGEVTEAEANGDAKADASAPKAEGDAATPKPKKKKAPRKKKAAKATTTEGAAPEAAADGTTAATTTEGDKKKKAPKAPRKPKVVRPAGEAPEGEPSKNMLFVANLGFTIDDAGLSTLFTDAGIKVVSARVVKRRWGTPRRSKGYGFVDVGTEDEQKKAIAALQGKEVAGREIAVKIAVDSAKDSESEAPVKDDYLSPKFLAEPTTTTSRSQAQTYAERRRAAQKAAEIKHEQNRKRSRRELEEAARENQTTSLFARAENEGGSKAMDMMRKMGFKPGQSLGRNDADDEDADAPPESNPGLGIKTKHRVEPVTASIWEGRKGLGLGKRAPSPSRVASERKSKVARVAAVESETREDFRDRSRDEWAERRAEGQLAAARRTCVTLDDKAGVEYNVFWLDIHKLASFPPDLLAALQLDLSTARQQVEEEDAQVLQDTALAERLRREVQTYRLHSLDDIDDQPPTAQVSSAKPVTEQQIQEARQHLALSAQQRLENLLAYLRERHAYCFWCGAQYDDDQDMLQSCPGPEEDLH